MSYSQTVNFLLGFEPRKVGDCSPSMTVLQYLRCVERMTGTKEGCAEGDCGACTVVIGSQSEGKIHYEAVNSCIMFLPFVNGKQLITVEHLKQSDQKLHPVQQAMVEEHGSQCGFCTPGFVMSMFAMFHNRVDTNKESIDNSLAGNLCRCTGYAPIVRATRRMFELLSSDQFDEQEHKTIEQFAKLDAGKSVHIQAFGQEYFAPSTKEELIAVLDEHPDSRIVAGATDVGLWVTKQGRELGTMVYILGVDALRELSVENDRVRIGSAVSVSRAMEVLSRYYPALDELFLRYGSVQIRNLATIGGNVANGSPIGDSLPALVALQAQLVITSSSGSRTVSAEEFFVDYGVQDLNPGEFLEQISVPLPAPGSQFRIYKLSKRYFQDISAVCGAFSVNCDQFGNCDFARICFGGMAATPKRARQCENALVEYGLTKEGVEAAKKAIERDFSPITDFRASADYRLQVAANLVEKFVNDVAFSQSGSVWKTMHA